MIQASRIVIIGLLALMQMIAPLVHAHAGGGQSPGIMHVPGLEFLAKSSGTSAQSSLDKASLDIIVSLAPGLKDKGDLVAPDLEYVLPVHAGIAPILPAFRAGPSPNPTPPLLQQVFSLASPRAPPLASAL